MCNTSLEEGCPQISQRHAIVTSRLKKDGANQCDAKKLSFYFRPDNHLEIRRKVRLRPIDQSVSYLQLQGLMTGLQSAFRRGHKTETAVLKIISDLLMAVDCGQITILGLLDLSAAFDTVDLTILADRLRRSFGIKLVVLPWIESFIPNRTQRVIFAGCLSSASPVTCGVTQGSVLGPMIFFLYTVDVFAIVRCHGISAHSYAGGTQLHHHPAADLCVASVSALMSCIGELGR